MSKQINDHVDRNKNNKVNNNFNNNTVKKDRASGRTIAAFVLGILSIVFCIAPFMLIAAVVGLMLEKESERYGYHHLQRAARILCIIGIILCSLVIAAILVMLFAGLILSRG